MVAPSRRRGVSRWGVASSGDGEGGEREQRVREDAGEGGDDGGDRATDDRGGGHRPGELDERRSTYEEPWHTTRKSSCWFYTSDSVLETTPELDAPYLSTPNAARAVTDRREGLALLAGELVVVSLALVLVAAKSAADAVAVAGIVLPPTALGGGLVVVGAGLGALRTADHVDPTAAVGELGLGVAAALALTTAHPLALATAGTVALLSARLRVDLGRVRTVLDR